MTFRHDDKDIANISELISKLDASKNESDKLLWFRGHDDFSWKMKPSISRESTTPIQTEFVYYKRFIQSAARILPVVPHDEWSWLFLMQHYALPTRLLDWSENPLVALYFAVSNPLHFDKDGALYVLNPVKYNKDMRVGSTIENDIPACGIDKELDSYLITSMNQPTPPSSTNTPVAVIGQRNSMRIHAQDGTFVVFGNKFDLFEMDPPKKLEWCWRFRIPKDRKPAIIKELQTLNIHEFYIFPELDKLAKSIKGRFNV